MARRFLDRPGVPYLVLLLTPVITLPLSAAILLSVPECGRDDPFWDETHWKVGYFELALLPGLGDLLPLVWLASCVAAVRRSAVIAGLLGGARFLVPQTLTILAHTSSGSLGSSSHCTISAFFGVALLYILPILWFTSTVISALIVLQNRGSWAAEG